MNSAVTVSGLRKTYPGSRGEPDVEAVRGVDLDVPAGQVFAVLGPNGAGKTTMLEILEGFRDRDGGDVAVLGSDPRERSPELRARIGIVLQEVAVEPALTVREAVSRQAGYYPDPRPVPEVIQMTGLDAKADSLVRSLSGGQQRKLDLALGVIGRPELLFLDEPTTGFDPAARREAWETVRGLVTDGLTIILTTHYMDEAQALADEIAVIATGRIVARGTPDDIGGRDRASTSVRFRLPQHHSADDIRSAATGPRTLPGGEPLSLSVTPDGHVEVVTATPVPLLANLTGWAHEAGAALEGLTVLRPTLEDVYLKLVADRPSDDAGRGL